MHRRIARGQIELACVELGDVGEEAGGGAPLSRRRGGEGVLQRLITQMRKRVGLHGDTQPGRVPGATDALFLSRPFHGLREPAPRDKIGLDETFSSDRWIVASARSPRTLATLPAQRSGLALNDVRKRVKSNLRNATRSVAPGPRRRLAAPSRCAAALRRRGWRAPSRARARASASPASRAGAGRR